MTLTDEFNLDDYFRRIGYSGRSDPTPETLQGILAAHVQRIPFENLDPLVGRTVALDAEALQTKLVCDGRGGYCYEHNLLLAPALQACGFEVAGLATRVIWGRPAGGPLGPRSLMLLRVEAGGERCLADVGFGGLTPTGPLRLEAGIEQATPHEPFRLTAAGGDYVMEALVRGEWAPLYRFDLSEHLQTDYELANWYLCTHSSSPFRQGLMASRPAKGRRYTLRNNEFAVHLVDGETERRTLTSVAEIRGVLQDSFLVTLPDACELDAALARIVGQQPEADRASPRVG